MKSKPAQSPALVDLVHQLTVACADNGRHFTDAERISQIKHLLEGASHRLAAELPLALIYRHPDFRADQPAVLLSSHIDSLYTCYHSRLDGQQLCGTYDNSITNAALIHLLLQGRLHPQVLVAFTGDEERDSRGADQVVEHLAKEPDPIRPELVIVLDVTEEAYDSHPASFENLFVHSGPDEGGSLKMQSQQDLTSFITSLDGIQTPHIVPDGAPDESWQYDEHSLSCLAICLPIQTITYDMHDDDGVYAKLPSLMAYAETVERFANATLARLGVLAG